MATMYLADRLLETYATDARVKRIVDNVDIYIVPVVNPDGYDYTRTVNSQWRKNRRDNPGTTCDGVDLNRNWGFQWGFDNVGSSGNQCDETYRGTAGFSEPELAGLKTQLDTIAGQGRLKAHVDVHANAQMILSVWGFRTSPPPPDLPVMNTLGQLMQTGMASVRGTVYPYGQGSVILYLNNGNARDYSYGVNNALAWTIELDGVSFQPAVSEILPISRELWNAFLPLSEYFIPAIPACYANCDQSTTAPVLNAGDFTCFLDGFRAGLSLSAAAQVTSYSNCDQSTTAPVLNAGDFTCFLTKFRAGCP
jgi:hypothetical protein